MEIESYLDPDAHYSVQCIRIQNTGCIIHFPRVECIFVLSRSRFRLRCLSAVGTCQLVCLWNVPVLAHSGLITTQNTEYFCVLFRDTGTGIFFSLIFLIKALFLTEKWLAMDSYRYQLASSRSYLSVISEKLAFQPVLRSLNYFFSALTLTIILAPAPAPATAIYWHLKLF